MTQAAPDKPQPHMPNYEFWREPDQPTDTRPDMRVTGFPETLADATPHDDPPITVRRGGIPWPVKPPIKDMFEEEAARSGRWVAPTHMLDPDGKPMVDPAPEHQLAQMIAKVFTPRPEREPEETTSGELPAWASELQYWWTSTTSSDIGGSIDKVVAYGGRGAAYDLIATGHDLAALNGRTVGDEEATELAILWYVSSKLNRLMAAAIDGRRGSDDTIFDSVYYLMMMRRNRAVGGWPVKAAPREKESPTT